MKKKVFLIFVILIINPLFGQSLRILDGFIDKYPIKMYLNFDSLNVVGYYFYKKYEKPIQITGEFLGNQLILTEQYYIKGETVFAVGGRFYLDENFSGKWKKKNIELNVNLNEINLNNKWENFNIKEEQIDTLKNNFIKRYSNQISVQIPDGNNNLENLILSSILDVKKVSNNSKLDYFNEYKKKNYSEYSNDVFFDVFPQYEIYITGIVVSLTDSVLNYKTNTNIYDGGARGYNFVNYYVFDLHEMTRLRFDDIFYSNTKNKIARLLFEKDNKEHDFDGFEKYIGNIYITNKGVGFFFNPDELGVFGGFFNYFLYYSELKGLVKY